MRTLCVLMFATAAVSAADNAAPAPGNYLLSYYPRPLMEQRMALLKVEDADGKVAITTLDAGLNKPEASGLTVSDKGIVSYTLKLAGGATTLTFEGKADPKDPKKFLGWLGNAAQTHPAELVATDAEKFDPKPAVLDLPEDMKKAQKQLDDMIDLRRKVMQSKDADEKKQLAKEAGEAMKKIEEEKPVLAKRVFANHPGTLAAAAAASDLMDRLGKAEPTADEAKRWAEAVVAHAAKYGPRIERMASARVAEQLSSQEKLASVAIPFAKAVADSDAPTAEKLKAYKSLVSGYMAAGQAELAKAAGAEVDKIDLVLDKEYLEKVPPFKPTKFGGRKDEGANRVAVFELFTGAQCGPCIASDVAFDGLLKSYKPTDVVLLQYHMHIPGPDPLTNPTSEGRFAYYGDKFPMAMRGTPSTLVNGKPAGGGGGAMAASEKKFTEFRGLIDPTLESKAAVTLDGSAKGVGDVVTVNVAVGPGKDVPEGAKLRLLLVEENVRYTGGNGIRFHHHVVRTAVGDKDGVKVSGMADGKHTATANLADVRKALMGYLDEEGKERPFPNADRPLDLKELKVIALVQDDETGEILQALELPVVGGA